MIIVSHHARHRTKERCGIKSKGILRLANIAFEHGITHSETSGLLNGYMSGLFFYNCQANNVRLYGDRAYIFCNEVLVTVLAIPHKYIPLVQKLMKRRENL